MTMIEHPFVEGDYLEISIYISLSETLSQTYVETPNGERLVGVNDLSHPWNVQAVIPSDGTYRVYFDNIDSEEPKEIHVLITYHEIAPGSKILR